jgi:glucoamylase
MRHSTQGVEIVAEESDMSAPGWPGIPPRWTSSAKSGLGTAVSRDSRVWFTLSHGILNEIYYPRVDHACTRDLGFIVTDGQTYFSEEKRDARSETSQVARGVPAYQIRNTAVDGRYRIEKEVLTDPWRDVVLQRVRFVPLQGTLTDFRLYALLAPHLSNRGSGNTAWVGDYKGTPMLMAERDNFALALASSAPWLARSVGFVGISDGWQQLQARKTLTRTYLRAENGNVAVTGEIDLDASDGVFVVAVGFGPTAMEAGQHARISLAQDDQKRHGSWGFPAVAVPPQRGSAADARIETCRRRRHRQPVDPVGLLQGRRRPGRVPPDVAAGSGRDGGRLPGRRRAPRRKARAPVPGSDAGAGRPLVAEHVARWHAVLAGRADGRNGASDSPGGSRRARRRD